MKPENLRLINDFLGDFKSEMIDEVWKDVDGMLFPTKVSNYGRMAKYYKNKVYRWRLHTPSKPINNRGYYRTSFSKDEKPIFVHRIVGNLFLDKVDGKTIINHKNGIKTDNRVDNLEWCTMAENNAHAIRIGLNDTKGSKNARCVINEEIAKCIKIDLANSSMLLREIAQKYNVKLCLIGSIKYNHSWKHILI